MDAAYSVDQVLDLLSADLESDVVEEPIFCGSDDELEFNKHVEMTSNVVMMKAVRERTLKVQIMYMVDNNC
jgi:hypothetical protein